MPKLSKSLSAALAGQAAGEATYVDDVFSTYLYTGNGSVQGISNGIALADGVGGGTSTEFDRIDDYLKKSADLSGSQGSKTFTLSFWVYDNIGEAGNSRNIYNIFDGSAYYSFTVYFLSTDGYLRITGRNSSGTVILDQKITSVVRKKNTWLHVLMSFDLSDSAKRHYAVNDVVGTPSNTTYTNDTIAFNNGSPVHSIAGSYTGTTLHDGRLAHFYMDYTYRDLSVEANRRYFIDANGGSTSVATQSALSPILYLPMTDGYSVGENLGTGGDFTAYGSPTIVDVGTEWLSGYGQGGMVWLKDRNAAENHCIYDTERGAGALLVTNTTAAQSVDTFNPFDFTSSGFLVGQNFGGSENNSGNSIASWTFRKAPGFFDVVTYTGTGSAQSISHNLGCVPGCIIVKRLDAAVGWPVYHKSNGNTGLQYLNTTAAKATSATAWDSTDPTSTTFTVNTNVNNINGGQFVAYLFADGDDAAAQIFGTDGDQAVVKCGSYTGNGGDLSIDCGFEPQFVIIKNSTNAYNWQMHDNMRGVPTGGNDSRLHPNLSNAEATDADYVDFNATGFTVHGATGGNVGASGHGYIYIAIRRPHKPAESGTEVFDLTTHFGTGLGNTGAEANGVKVTSDVIPDLVIAKLINGTSQHRWWSRLTGNNVSLASGNTDSEYSGIEDVYFDHSDGWVDSYFGDAGSSNESVNWGFKRSPGFFDVVCYEGTGSAQNISHNLGVVPEMIICMKRTGAASTDKPVYHASLGNSTSLTLNTTNSTTTANYWNSTTPTDSVFTLGDTYGNNGSTYTYVAYLFASQDGISKVGSYTGTGAAQNIDCGFSSGARFVLIKATHSGTTCNWLVFDTERGIVAGADSLLSLNTTSAENTATDWIDPYSAGFSIASTSQCINESGGTYIYLAIA